MTYDVPRLKDTSMKNQKLQKIQAEKRAQKKGQITRTAGNLNRISEVIKVQLNYS